MNLIIHEEHFLPKGIMKKVKASCYYQRLRKAPLGANPEVWTCAHLSPEEVLAIYPESTPIIGSTLLEGEESEFVGARYCVSPHTDEDIRGEWSNFMIVQGDGLELKTAPLTDAIKAHQVNQQGQLLALNIWEPHWVEPSANQMDVRAPYIWLGITLQTNKPLPPNVLIKLMDAHTKRYIANDNGF